MELSERLIKHLSAINDSLSELVQDKNVSIEDKLDILASVDTKIEGYVYGLHGDFGKV